MLIIAQRPCAFNIFPDFTPKTLLLISKDWWCIMANSWLRLWHEMPNDPKWRTIARISGQPISLVQAIYIHLLVSASRNVTRGHVDVTNEDLASALDSDDDAISAVLNAMQGRVLDDDYLTGWERRQPKREDLQRVDNGAKSAAQRKRDQRDRERQQNQQNNDVTESHALSPNVTLDKDKDTEKEEETTQTADAVRAAAASSRLAPEPGLKKQIDCPYSELAALYATHFPHKRQPRTLSARRKALLLKGWKHGLVTRKRDKSEMLYTDTASGVEFWGRFMAHIANNCRFCMQVQNNFDIEWLFSPRAIDNIIDGKYDTVRDGGRSIT